MKSQTSLFVKLLLFSTILMPQSVFASVTPPWSTTYNCTPWNGTYCTINCDGLSCGGSWTTSYGSKEQILADANNPSGGGGLGQRHFFWDAVADNSGGTLIDLTSPQPNLWVRWYMRFQAGVKSWPAGDMKILYYLDTTGTQFCAVDIYKGNWDAYEQYGDTKHHYSTGMGFDAIWGVVSDGSWHAFEVHFKRETSASNDDGIVELWVDGVRVMNATDADWGMAKRGSAGISMIKVGENHKQFYNGKEMYLDYDDIAVSNTGYIGPLSGGGTQQPQAPPKNLRGN